jgi:DNA-binding NtrC family response regulator
MTEQDRTDRAPWQIAEVGADAILSLLVVREGDTSTHALPVSGRLVIGRSPDADVRVDHGSVSREHAALHLGSPLRIEDLGSANGTRLREVPLVPGVPVEVFPDDVIDLGAVLLVVQYRNPGARLRRTCHPTELELRVEEECERGDAEAPFALVRFEIERGLTPHAVQVVLAEALSEDDLLAAAPEGRFDALLLGAQPAEAEERVRAVVARLSQRGVNARTSVSCFPRDGRDAATLLGRRPQSVAAAARRGAGGRGDYVVRDPAMVHVVRLLERIADSHLNVLLLGETGAGKEVCAELTHTLSSRADKPLVRLNCASLSESLLDDELFGHERGAFTGASSEKPGLLEAGSGGTVFLDEIGDVPLTTQLKLLRVLESKEVRRLGSVKPRTIDVRIVAATNQDLRERITQGRFREDLFYRLDGISVVVPPLRDRPDDIEPLARHFVARMTKPGKTAPDLAPETLDWLAAHDWPGNVRELRNTIERATVLCERDVIRVEHLRVGLDRAGMAPAAAPTGPTVTEPTRTAASGSLRTEVKALERARIEQALQSCGGNQRLAAQALGLSRGALLRRLEQLGIPRPRKG